MRRSNGSFDPVAAQERALLLALSGTHGDMARGEALDLFREWLLSQPERLERLLKAVTEESCAAVFHWAAHIDGPAPALGRTIVGNSPAPITYRWGLPMTVKEEACAAVYHWAAQAAHDTFSGEPVDNRHGR